MSVVAQEVTCQRVCWVVGAVAGLLAAIFMMIFGTNWFLALLLAIILGVAVALLLMRLMCGRLPQRAGATDGAGTGRVAPIGAAAAADEKAEAMAGLPDAVPPIGASAAADERSEAVGADSETPAPIGASALAEGAASGSDHTIGEAGDDVTPAGASHADAPSDVPSIGSAAAAEQVISETQDRVADVPSIGSAAATEQRISDEEDRLSEVPSIGSASASEQKISDEEARLSGVAPIGSAASTEQKASDEEAQIAEVAAIGSASAAGDSAESAGSKDAPTSDGGGLNEDNGATLEGKKAGEKPSMMDAPRDGGADNLKEIKGVGPKLEKLLNSMGIYHFDQVANWTDRELAWVDANLAGFRGRASRDDWVAQAKILASGGETAFSRRVDEGDVY